MPRRYASSSVLRTDAQFPRQGAEVLTRLHPFQRSLTEVLIIFPRTTHFLLLLILLRLGRHLSTPLCPFSRVSVLGSLHRFLARCKTFNLVERQEATRGDVERLDAMLIKLVAEQGSKAFLFKRRSFVRAIIKRSRRMVFIEMQSVKL